MGGRSSAFSDSIPVRFVNFDAKEHLAFIVEANERDSLLVPYYKASRIENARDKQGMVALNASGRVIAVLLWQITQQQQRYQCELTDLVTDSDIGRLQLMRDVVSVFMQMEATQDIVTFFADAKRSLHCPMLCHVLVRFFNFTVVNNKVSVYAFTRTER